MRNIKKDTRKLLGKSQSEVAKEAGVSVKTVQRFEKGTSHSEKLEKYFKGAVSKNIRETLGFNQSELADTIGVSRSTIQRYESGVSKNKKVASFFQNIEKNSDLIVEFLEKRKEVLRKYKKLELKGFEDGPAYSSIKKSGLSDFDAILKNRRDLKYEISKLNDYLSYKTITEKGYKEWKKNLSFSVKKRFNKTNDSELEVLLKVFSMLKGTKLSRYWETGEFDSDQAEEDVNKVFSIYGVIDAESVFQILVDMSNKSYEESILDDELGELF